jgi:MraZ protein
LTYSALHDTLKIGGEKWRKVERFLEGSISLLNGGFVNTLDDKGRVTFPAKLRSGFSGDTLVITRGVDHCLWLYPPELWQDFAEKLSNASSMRADVRKMQRHFLGWAIEAEIDKSSRLAIPQSLRDYAGLSRNCVIMGVGKRIEIWDEERYKAANGDNGDTEADIGTIAEQFVDLF